LEKFSSLEKEKIKTTTPELIESLLEWIEKNNFEKIMSKFNNNNKI
jgi:peptidyl-tRNA hydrolase